MKRAKQIANNHMIIFDDNNNAIEFYSYNTHIATYYNVETNKDTLILSSKYDYSRTTSKYLKVFLQDYCYFYYKDSKELTKIIENGGTNECYVVVKDN